MNPLVQLRRYRNQEQRKLKAYERKYARLVLSVLNRQLKEAVNNIRYGTMFLDNDMFDMLSKLYLDVGINTANDQYDALTSFKTKASPFFLNSWRDYMTNYILANMATRVTRINETTRKKIQETIAIGSIYYLT